MMAMKSMQKALGLAAAAGLMALGAGRGWAAEPYYELPVKAAVCSDDSLKHALADGVKLGISEGMPWSGRDAASGKYIGIDVEIMQEVLNQLGIKYDFTLAQFNSLIPSMLSNRLDAVVADVHVTPERLKTIAFSGPAWWYGPALVVQKGNPKKIASFDDLKSVKIGVLLGSGPDEYLRQKGIDAVRFQSYAEEFASLQQERVDVVVEYDLLAAQFLKQNPGANVESVTNFNIPADLIKNGYGYARFGFRKEDCSLVAAVDQALAEARASGAVSAILARYGLSDRNLFVFAPVVK